MHMGPFEKGIRYLSEGHSRLKLGGNNRGGEIFSHSRGRMCCQYQQLLHHHLNLNLEILAAFNSIVTRSSPATTLFLMARCDGLVSRCFGFLDGDEDCSHHFCNRVLRQSGFSLLAFRRQWRGLFVLLCSCEWHVIVRIGLNSNKASSKMGYIRQTRHKY